jgi:hypothetical protein
MPKGFPMLCLMQKPAHQFRLFYKKALTTHC